MTLKVTKNAYANILRASPIIYTIINNDSLHFLLSPFTFFNRSILPVFPDPLKLIRNLLFYFIFLFIFP